MVARKTQTQTSCTRTKRRKTTSERTFGDEVKVPLPRQWRCPSHVQEQIREHLRLHRRLHRRSLIFSEMCRGGHSRVVLPSSPTFARRESARAIGLAVLIPPGADLLAVVYAVWRIGASIVVIDAAHGARSLLRSLKGARVDHVVAVRHAAPVVRLLNVPGEVFWQHRLAGLLDAEAQPRGVAAAHVAHSDAAIVFTSERRARPKRLRTPEPESPPLGTPCSVTMSSPTTTSSLRLSHLGGAGPPVGHLLGHSGDGCLASGFINGGVVVGGDGACRGNGHGCRRRR